MARPDKKQIDAWKEAHGDIFQITVEGKIIILREPKIKDLERAASADPKGNKRFNFNRSIVENCKLYEDKDVMDSDKKIMAVFSQLDELIPVAEAETKKL